MTTSVDVLAVMDSASLSLFEACRNADARSLDKARAAVAELIEALDIAAYGEYLPESVEQKIRAALDRVTGA